jgi:hypothetical protein
MGQPARHVVNEGRCITRRPIAVQPVRNQLRFGVDYNERPNIADPENVFHADGYVLLLTVAEGPNFVDFKPFASQVLHHPILIVGARAAHVYE